MILDALLVAIYQSPALVIVVGAIVAVLLWSILGGGGPGVRRR